MTNTKFPTLHFRWLSRSEQVQSPSSSLMYERAIRCLQQFWQYPDGPHVVDGLFGEWVDVPEVEEERSPANLKTY